MLNCELGRGIKGTVGSVCGRDRVVGVEFGVVVIELSSRNLKMNGEAFEVDTGDVEITSCFVDK